MEQTETLEIVTKPEDGVVVFEQFKNNVIQSVDGQIGNQVKPLEDRLNKLKVDYAGAEVVTDAATFKKAKEATAAFRTLKGDIESTRKLWKGVMIQLGDIVDDKYNPLKEEAEKLQKQMDGPAKEFEAEKERIRKQKQEEKDRLWLHRSALLTSLNALYSDDHFILGDAIVKKDMVVSLDDTVFADVLNGFQEAHDKIEAEAKEQERLKQEAADKLRQEQEEFQRQKEEFEKQQQLLKEQQEALRKQQEEIEKRDRIRQEEVERALRWEKAEAERKEREKFEAEQKAVENALKQRREARMGQMSELGLTYNGQYQSFVFEDVNVHVNELILEDKEWDTLIETITPVIADRKAEAEKQRQEEEEQQRIEKEKEIRAKLEAERKEKQVQEAAAKLAAMESARDKEKWAEIEAHLKATPIYEMRSSQYRTKMKTVRDFIADL